MASPTNFFAAPPRPKPVMNQTAQARSLAMRQRSAMRPPVPAGAPPGSNGNTASPPPSPLPPSPAPVPVPPVPGGNAPAPVPNGNGPAPVDYTKRMVGVPIPGVNMPVPGAVPGQVPGQGMTGMPGSVPPVRPAVPGAPPILAPNQLADMQKRAMGGN